MSCPALNEFDIGWICALPVESAAARLMLDEEFAPLQEKDPADSNAYTLGRIGDHNIVIACLPAGQYGITSATTVAKDMLRTFSASLRVGLMVGVGGGIPSPDHDIRLGDIVISCPDGISGGVVQYDTGKITAGGKHQRTGFLNSPPRSLLAAVNNMRAAELTDDPRYPQYLQNAIGRNVRTRKNFSRPDSRYDRLFKIEYPHPEAAKNCDTCLSEWEKPRDQREDDIPHPFYGIIASGNAVIKDGSTRESIRSETGALCFEMEAAGLMQDFPCIVIRGICDYSDSHKNKSWQGYAALAAASYAKELLESLPRGQVSRERLATDICRSIQELNEDVKGTNHRLDKAYDQQSQHYLDDKQRQCHQVFKTSTYEQYKNINPSRERGTCQWVLQDPNYLRWRGSGRNDLLWISADPGCGKSVLAKSLIDGDLNESTPPASICYFFFKDNDDQNNLSVALCALLHQLFSQYPSLLHHAIPSWEKNGRNLQREVSELWRILLAATSHSTSPNIICVLDALDECHPNDRKQLIQGLHDFYTSGQSDQANPPTCLKFIVTSRPYNEINIGLRNITSLCPHIHLNGEKKNALIHKEIDTVVRTKVQELAEITGISRQVQQRVEQQLLQMKNRTYLWLHLAMDDIQTMLQESLRPAEESISLVPTSVYDAYAKILDRVPPGQEDTVRKILQVIVGARWPLSTHEMAMALGVATKVDAVNAAEAMLPEKGLEAKLRQLCGLFVFTDNSKIHLIHQTAREFLIQHNVPSSAVPYYHFRWIDTQDLLAEICTRYLLMKDLDSQLDADSDIMSFLEYSAMNWADHVRSMRLSSYCDLKDLVYFLYDIWIARLQRRPSVFKHVCHDIFDRWKKRFPGWKIRNIHALQLAAFNGHLDIVQRLLSNSGNATMHKFGASPGNLQRGPGTTVIKGHKQIVDSPGHNVIFQEPRNERPSTYLSVEQKTFSLCIASWTGYYEIYQSLFEGGANLSPLALVAASSVGHYEIVQDLLDKGVDYKLQENPYTTALEEASFYGHYDVVQLLLRSNIDVNFCNIYSRFGTPLQAASQGGHLEIIQILLKKGAVVNPPHHGWQGTALIAASDQGDHRIVRTLLEAGAKIHYGDYRNSSALFNASMNGHIESVRVLVEYGADVNFPFLLGLPLGTASRNNRVEVMRYLLRNGANIEGRCSLHGPTALMLASAAGRFHAVRALLEEGACVHAESNSHGNALISASNFGTLDTVQILLDYGADINAYVTTHGTALQAACARGHEKIVKLLLDRGANANAPDGRYGNALQVAFTREHCETVQLLLENGANVDTQNGEYDDVLQAAYKEGHARVMQVVLEKRAKSDFEGTTREKMWKYMILDGVAYRSCW